MSEIIWEHEIIQHVIMIYENEIIAVWDNTMWRYATIRKAETSCHVLCFIRNGIRKQNITSGCFFLRCSWRKSDWSKANEMCTRFPLQERKRRHLADEPALLLKLNDLTWVQFSELADVESVSVGDPIPLSFCLGFSFSTSVKKRSGLLGSLEIKITPCCVISVSSGSDL